MRILQQKVPVALNKLDVNAGIHYSARRKRILHVRHAFFDKQAIANSNRLFADLAETEETQIRNWNLQVGDDDRVFHLEDFWVKKSAARNLEPLDRLRDGYAAAVGLRARIAGMSESEFSELENFQNSRPDAAPIVGKGLRARIAGLSESGFAGLRD